jgi:hypothetical protein
MAQVKLGTGKLAPIANGRAKGAIWIRGPSGQQSSAENDVGWPAPSRDVR